MRVYYDMYVDITKYCEDLATSHERLSSDGAQCPLTLQGQFKSHDFGRILFKTSTPMHQMGLFKMPN